MDPIFHLRKLAEAVKCGQDCPTVDDFDFSKIPAQLEEFAQTIKLEDLDPDQLPIVQWYPFILSKHPLTTAFDKTKHEEWERNCPALLEQLKTKADEFIRNQDSIEIGFSTQPLGYSGRYETLEGNVSLNGSSVEEIWDIEPDGGLTKITFNLLTPLDLGSWQSSSEV